MKSTSYASTRRPRLPLLVGVGLFAMALGALICIAMWQAPTTWWTGIDPDESVDPMIDPTADPDEFAPVRVVEMAFPPIRNAPIVDADAAESELIRDDELVLGVVVNDEARAYSINMLTSPTREIINDRLGDRPIAATW